MLYHRVPANDLNGSLYPERDNQVRAAIERMKPYMVHLGPDVQFMLELDGGPEPQHGIYGIERCWYNTYVNPPIGEAKVLISGMAVKELSPSAFQGLAEHELCAAVVLTMLGNLDMSAFREVCENESSLLCMRTTNAMDRMVGLGNFVPLMIETMNADYKNLDDRTTFNYDGLTRYFEGLGEVYPLQADEIMSNLVFRQELRGI